MSSNMYDTYDGCKFSYYTPSTFDNRTKEYLLNRYSPKASWDYEDTLAINFKLTELPNVDEELLDSLDGKNILVNFYNFRHEKIPFAVELEASEEFTVLIDYETSYKYFDRGTYYCSVKLLTYSNGNDRYIVDYCTILPQESCCFYVQ